MNARDIMTTGVVSISPETPASKIAELLGKKGISAVPVVDKADIPIGMVSEGDLIGRDEAAREARRGWWLTLLAEGEMLNPDFLAALRSPERVARDVMSAPVVTVGEETDINEIAQLLTAYRIKRVPVQHPSLGRRPSLAVGFYPARLPHLTSTSVTATHPTVPRERRQRLIRMAID